MLPSPCTPTRKMKYHISDRLFIGAKSPKRRLSRETDQRPSQKLKIESDSILSQIEHFLEESFKANPRENIFVKKGEIVRAQEALEKFGIVILLDAITPDDIACLKKQAAKDISSTFPDLPEEVHQRLQDGNIFAIEPHHIVKNGFGSCVTRMMFRQPAENEKEVTVSTGEKMQIVFNPCMNTNIEFLHHHRPDIYEFMRDVTNLGVVSADSFKVLNNSEAINSSKQAPYTKAHYDIYDQQASSFFRTQGFFNDDYIRGLAFVPFSHKREFISLISKYTERDISSSGYQSVHDKKLIGLFCKYGVIPPQRSYTMWKHVIHFEANRDLSPLENSDTLIDEFHPFKIPRNSPVFRLYAGTQNYTNISEEDIAFIAVCRHFGLTPAMFKGFNKLSNLKLAVNFVNRKSTQYLKKHNYSKSEREKINQAVIEVLRAKGNCCFVCAAKILFDAQHLEMHGLSIFSSCSQKNLL